MTEHADDWATVDDAAERIGRSRRRVYEYLTLAADRGSTIRTMRVHRRTYVNVPDLLRFEATVPPPGRPRKERS